MLDRRERAEQSRIVQQAIESAVAREQRVRQLIVIARQRLLQVEHRDAGRRRAARGNLLVNGFERCAVSADQHERGLVTRTGDGDRTPDT